MVFSSGNKRPVYPTWISSDLLWVLDIAETEVELNWYLAVRGF